MTCDDLLIKPWTIVVKEEKQYIDIETFHEWRALARSLEKENKELKEKLYPNFQRGLSQNRFDL